MIQIHNNVIHSRSLSDKPAKLYVVTSISNPARYSSRYNLYRRFEKMVKDGGGELYTVESAFGNRHFQITEKETPYNIQVRTRSELWHKENLLNIGMNNLPDDWEYVAWIDADVAFARPDWVSETLHQLQHYDFVQMFSKAQDLLPNHDPMQQHYGFVYSYINNRVAKSGYSNWHPGFAWAARRSAIDKVGGLIDFAVLGAADRHMAFGLIGKMDETVPEPLLNGAYGKHLRIWQDRAEKYILRNIGYVDGLLLHYWHGKKKDRRYQDRWKILLNNNYDPELDLKRDSQGVWQLTDRNIELRDDIRKYFRSRNEDSIDFDPLEVRM